MFNIFNLNNYKEYLISYCFYDLDNKEERKLERKKILEHRYSDEFLLNVIENTQEFIFNLLESCQSNYISIEMVKDKEYIFTNCTFGYYPDVLISISDFNGEKKISKYLLEKFLGKSFKTYFDVNEVETHDEEDEDLVIGCIYETQKFVIVGDFSKRREEIKKEKQTELVRVLKRHISN